MRASLGRVPRVHACMKRALVPVLVLASRLAAADGAIEPTESRDAVMLYDMRPLHRADLGLHWGVDAVAAAIESTDGDASNLVAAGTIGAVVGITASPDCDLAQLGGQLAARSDDRVLSAQQTASLCLFGGNGQPPTDGHLSIDHRLEWDMEPRLLAPLRLRPGHQRRETVGIDFAGSHVPWHGRGPGAATPETEWLRQGEFRLETEVGWSPDSADDDVRVRFDIIEFREFRKDYPAGPPLVIAFFAPRLDALFGTGDPADPSIAGLAGDLVRLDGLRVGDFRLGARLGGSVMGQSRGKGPTYVQRLDGIAEGGVSVERDLARGLTTRLAGERRSWPAYDTRLVVDNRASWSLLAAFARLHAGVELSVARTRLVDIAASHVVGTGGIAADAAYDLGRGLALELHGEAGRSAYAASATLDAPRWASETLLMLAGHAGSL